MTYPADDMMMSMVGAVRLLIVDNHTLVREGLREILNAEEDFVVVAEAADSARAIGLAGRLRPDVVLLDVEIPGGGAPETVARILAVSPGSRVIVVSVFDEPCLVQDLLDVGIRGYLLKSVTRAELVSAVRAVQGNDARIVLSISCPNLAPHDSRTRVLSSREREVLQLVALALTNAQIARRLYITEGTVKRHLRNIFDKLSAVSRMDAVNKAAARSLLPLPWPGAKGGSRRVGGPAGK